MPREWRKLCCALSLSPRSEAVVRTGAGLARLLDAQLVLLHVDDQMPEGAVLDTRPEMREAQHRDRAYALEQRRRAAMDARGGEVAVVLLSDPDPVQRIVRFAREESCDLLLVGDRAAWPPHPFVSATEKLVRHAPCSVLVARG